MTEQGQTPRTVEDIPADVSVTLTVELVRAFRARGCNPGCHNCRRKLVVGETFMLAELHGRDEMLGDCCTKEQLNQLRATQARKEEKVQREHREYKRVHPGYSRPHHD